MTRPQAPTLALNLGEQISKVLLTQADGITITYKLAFSYSIIDNLYQSFSRIFNDEFYFCCFGINSIF